MYLRTLSLLLDSSLLYSDYQNIKELICQATHSMDQVISSCQLLPLLFYLYTQPKYKSTVVFLQGFVTLILLLTYRIIAIPSLVLYGKKRSQAYLRKVFLRLLSYIICQRGLDSLIYSLLIRLRIRELIKPLRNYNLLYRPIIIQRKSQYLFSY